MNDSRYSKMKKLAALDNFLAKGAKALNSINEVIKNPNPVSIVKTAMEGARHGLKMGPFKEYRTEDWKHFYPPSHHTNYLVSLLKTCRNSDFTIDNEKFTFSELYTHMVMYPDAGSSWYVKFDPSLITEEKVNSMLRDKAWEQLGNFCEMVVEGKWNDTVSYRSKNLCGLISSAASIDMVARMRQFVSMGVNRSLLLCGAPGTGKSTILNNIASEFGKRILSIDVSNLSYSASGMLSDSIDFLKPDVIIVNDIDRFSGIDLLLGTLENVNSTTKMLLASANDLEKLPDACKRPGRFDDIVEITTIEDAIIDQLIGIPKSRIPEAVYTELRTFPAAFIKELGKRVKCFGEDSLVKEFSSLQSRAKEALSAEDNKVVNVKK